MKNRKFIPFSITVALMAFALLTIFLSSSVLFGLYETTIGALIFRIAVSIVFALLAYWRIVRKT